MTATSRSGSIHSLFTLVLCLHVFAFAADPPRRSLDWCSPKESCGKGLTCISKGTSKCRPSGFGCYCAHIPEIICDSFSKCSDPDETCAYNTERGTSKCVSCNVVATDVFYQPHKNNTKCKPVTPLPTPTFPPPSNGLSEDSCSFDIDCQPPYQCAIGNGKSCGIHSASCTCQDMENDTEPCNDASECRVGEVCAKTTGNPQCLSISYVQNLPQTDYQVLGEFPERGSNVTGDTCRIDYDCADGLYCTHESIPFPPGGCMGRRACSCKGLQLQVCTSSDQCRTGEVCVNVPDARNDAYCFSAKVTAIDPYVREVSSTASPTPTVLPTDGWAGDLCKKDKDCKKGPTRRLCLHYLERVGVGPCNGRDLCICKIPSDFYCTANFDCGSEEICVVVKDSPRQVPGECISEKLLDLQIYDDIYTRFDFPTPDPSQSALEPSPDFSPSWTPDMSLGPSSVKPIPTSAAPSPPDTTTPASSKAPSTTPEISEGAESSDESPTAVTESPNTSMEEPNPSNEANGADSAESAEPSVCVDADALTHLPSSHLVYAKAWRAVVLCDKHESCATSGHIVHWRTVPMMMRTYCERYATCTRRIKHVNSPRMRRGLKIPTRTEGLEFTPLAARFSTRVEEAVLRRIIYFGF